ncbi:MAG: DEAD/DEAH box helicase family protein [Herbinix sp.]|nr:DEAD/DEAH box helicase family protein [Herbinix sp.]
MIQVRQTSIIIPDYNMGDNPRLEKKLSLFNDVYFRVEYRGMRYNEQTKELRVPRGIDVGTINRNINELQFENSYSQYDKAVFNLTVPPKDKIQERAINYLLGSDKNRDTSRLSQIALNLDTGDGKTYCTIAALSFYKCKSMIITHLDKIKRQWMDSFLKFTDLHDDFICDIDSSSKMRKLMNMRNIPYKVFFINHQTINSFVSSEGAEELEKFFEKIRIGIKVYDEAHLNFGNIITTDMFSNVYKTIYLTATLERSDFKENALYLFCLKNVIKYGSSEIVNKRKHIVFVGYLFNSNPSNDDRVKVLGYKGFDKNFYIDYQMKKDSLMIAIVDLLNFFNKQDGRTLILSSKIDSSNKIAEYLKSVFPDKLIGVVNSTIPEEEKQKIMDTYDIISSTPKSAGTGVDISNIRFCINTEPYSSGVMGKQISGRLRMIDANTNSFYIELVDKGFDRVVKMYKKRLPLFKKRCLKVIEMDKSK